ncbi:tryptophan synthase beta subunit-like PLP-dependent enzyme [Hypoxylon rubiginosum]|uniref:Tryptophan synthase beta subunit-like PLP-dependent enzyme n=1 Tax=Hypoxylon rubiginosum TaxID=110542 RepID=A0ACC0DIB7_9PEZI|nr:tryptophan synthase beta subunit-like PLP-dependent enzyme [Hypoxylon rubiginosum]
MADQSTSPPLTRASVAEARELIRPFVHRTPVITSSSLSALASTSGQGKARPKFRLWFKCENFQKVGAFKARGAFHAIERLKKEPGWLAGGGAERGVVTHSSGNHAQALSLAARANGIPAYIVMPTISAPPKIAATKGYGATVIFSGSTSVEREAVTTKVIEDTGARLVPPYDHPDIVLGQGTLGLEFQEQVEAMMAEEGGEKTRGKKGLDAIIAPCGGGGMLSGVALSCEGTGIRVFGSEPSYQGADDAKRGYKSGVRVEAVSSLTVADGLRTPVGRIPWSIIYERRLVSGFYSVSDADIVRAMKLAYERLKVVIEPSSAVPLAVALYNEDFRAMVEQEAGEEGWDLGIVFSGGNVSLDALGKLFADGGVGDESK